MFKKNQLKYNYIEEELMKKKKKETTQIDSMNSLRNSKDPKVTEGPLGQDPRRKKLMDMYSRKKCPTAYNFSTHDSSKQDSDSIKSSKHIQIIEKLNKPSVFGRAFSKRR